MLHVTTLSGKLHEIGIARHNIYEYIHTSKLSNRKFQVRVGVEFSENSIKKVEHHRGFVS